MTDATFVGRTAVDLARSVRNGDWAARAVAEAMFRYGKHSDVRVTPVYGGQPIGRQLQSLLGLPACELELSGIRQASPQTVEPGTQGGAFFLQTILGRAEALVRRALRLASAVESIRVACPNGNRGSPFASCASTMPSER